MMNSKKISTALLCIVMLISMLSCFVPGVSAADHNLGYAVTIEEGNFVGGKQLPNDVVIVNDDWLNKTGRVALKLDDQVYYGWLGQNAFATLALATQSAVVQSGTTSVQTEGVTIYVAPGTYKAPVEVYGNNIRLYGPMAGVDPNAKYVNSARDLSNPNTNRPASVGGMDLTEIAKKEAVITNRITLRDHGIDTIVDGFYFSGSGQFYVQEGYKHRTGFYIRNNIFDVTSEYILNFATSTSSTSYKGDVEFTNNRVLNGRAMLHMWFVMDVTIQNNYINLDPADPDDRKVAVVCNTVEANSIGDNLLIDNNYFPVTYGLFQFNVSTNYDTMVQGITISNNVIDNCSAASSGLIYYQFMGEKNMSGTMISVIGNEFKALSAAVAPFQFYYRVSPTVYVRFRYIFNINENYMDLPYGAKLVYSEVKGVLNMARNYYTNGITKNQIEMQDDEIKLVLTPQYADPSMTVLGEGGGQITGIKNVAKYSIDEEKQLVTLNLENQDIDSLDLTNVLEVSPGCTWSLYEDETLNTRVSNKVLYLDGMQTDRYVFIETDDDSVGRIYRIHAIRDSGTNAEMLGIVFNTKRDIPDADPAEKSFVYNLEKNERLLAHSIKVSAGATYKLYADRACTVPLTDLGDYIPYGNNYTFYVYVESEDKTKNGLYTVSFNREVSEFDPAVVAMTADKNGDATVRNEEGTLIYDLVTMEQEVTLELTTSPNSSYLIKDAAGKELSSSLAPTPLKLTEGNNNFKVEVTDGLLTRTLDLTVENELKSSDAVITGVDGVSATVADGKIAFIGGGDNTNITFSTRNKYATCEIFADKAHTAEKKMAYTSTPTPEGAHVLDVRTFSLPTALTTNRYFVVCTAEDGVTTMEYELIISKNTQVKDYADVTDPNEWYYDEVIEAGNKGLLIGSDDNGVLNFRPLDNITREEMAVVIVRLIGINPANYSSTTLSFTDAGKIQSYAVDAVKTCQALGIFKGSDEGTALYFNPQNPINRQETMALFARAMELSGTISLARFADADAVESWAVEEVQAVVAAGLIQGSDEGGVLKLNPLAFITRAEMAAICSRVNY